MRRLFFIVHLAWLFACNDDLTQNQIHITPNTYNQSDSMLVSLVKITLRNDKSIKAYQRHCEIEKEKKNKHQLKFEELGKLIEELERTNDKLTTSTKALQDYIENNRDKEEYKAKADECLVFLEQAIKSRDALVLASADEIYFKRNTQQDDSFSEISTGTCLLKNQIELNNAISLFEKTSEMLSEELKKIQGIKTKTQLKDEEFESVSKNYLEAIERLKVKEKSLQELLNKNKSLLEAKNLSEDQKIKLEEELAKLKEQQQLAQQNIASLSAQIQELGTALNETLESKKNELQRLTEEKQAILEANGLSEEEKTKLREDLKVIEDQKSTLESDRERFDREFQEVKEKANEEKIKMQAQISELSEEIIKLQAEYKNIKEQKIISDSISELQMIYAFAIKLYSDHVAAYAEWNNLRLKPSEFNDFHRRDDQKALTYDSIRKTEAFEFYRKDIMLNKANFFLLKIEKSSFEDKKLIAKELIKKMEELKEVHVRKAYQVYS